MAKRIGYIGSNRELLCPKCATEKMGEEAIENPVEYGIGVITDVGFDETGSCDECGADLNKIEGKETESLILQIVFTWNKEDEEYIAEYGDTTEDAITHFAHVELASNLQYEGLPVNVEVSKSD